MEEDTYGRELQMRGVGKEKPLEGSDEGPVLQGSHRGCATGMASWMAG